MKKRKKRLTIVVVAILIIAAGFVLLCILLNSQGANTLPEKSRKDANIAARERELTLEYRWDEGAE